MPAEDLHVETPHDETPANLVEVGVYSNERDGFDHGLVSLMLGHPFWLVPSDATFRLLVEPTVAEEVREQLKKYDRESVGWPPPPIPVDASRRPAEWFTPLTWALSVLAAFWVQTLWPGITEAGLLDPRAVMDRGEIWRTVTALFLHADIGHLISNLISGVFVFSAVLTTMGRRRGWLAIAAAAVLGNFAAVAMNAANDYRSLGASTAVFGALGLLTGRAIRRLLETDHPHRLRALFGALAAGVTVLGLYGAGGQQVDVLAHVTGFISGAILAGLGRGLVWSATA